MKYDIPINTEKNENKRGRNPFFSLRKLNLPELKHYVEKIKTNSSD